MFARAFSLPDEEMDFSSGNTKISVTHIADDSYRVDVNSGHNEFTIQATIPLTLFSSTNLLAYHKAARDVVHQAIEAGQLAPENLRWMRHRSGDDGDAMLVLCPVVQTGVVRRCGRKAILGVI